VKCFGKAQPGMDYAISNACVNTLIAILARDNSGQVITAYCPGWVDIEMGGIVRQPSKTPQDATRIPVYLGFGDQMCY